MSKVSILLPTFNRELYLATAIESVLAQTHQDWELLISDNCSSDNTLAIASKYADQDKRIICWKNETNIGALPNYNKCIEKASGDYIELFGTDDIFEDTCIEKLVQALNENPKVALATSAKRHIDENGQQIREDRLRNESQIIPSQEAIHNSLSNLTNSIISPVMFRSKYKGSGFDLTFGNCADLEYWTQILQCGDLFYIDEILFNYRVHNGSETTRTLVELEFAILLLRIAERHKEYLVNPGDPDLAPYKIVVEKLMDIVDYSTSYLKLDFSQFFGALASNDKNKIPTEIENQSGKSNDLNDDLHDFKRVSYLSLLHAIDLRKELHWLRNEYNDLQIQCQNLINEDISEERKEIFHSPIKKSSWAQHERVLNTARNDNTALQHRIDQLSTELNSLLNSKSWRITAPLRMAMKLTSGRE